MEAKFEFQSESPFETAYENLLTSQDFQRLEEKFKVKPFYFKFKQLKTFLSGFTWFIQIVTIAVCFMAIIGLMSPMMPYSMACLISGFALGGIEILKRLSFKPSVKDYLQFKKFSVFQLVIAFLMLGISLWLTWNGTHKAVFELSAAPTLLNVDSSVSYEKQRIAELTKQLTDVKKTQSWRGVLTPKGQSSYNRVTEQIAKLQDKLAEKETDLTSKNEQTTTNHLTQTSQNATHFKYLTLCLDLLLFALLAWLEYYDFRSLVELAKLKTAMSNENRTHIKNNNVVYENGTAKRMNENRYENRMAYEKDDFDDPALLNKNRTVIKGFRRDASDNSTPSVKEVVVERKIIISEGTAVCQNCGNAYVSNHKKQRFCSNVCRTRAWEIKNGKKLRNSAA